MIFNALKLYINVNRGKCSYLTVNKLYKYIVYLYGDGFNMHSLRFQIISILRALELPSFKRGNEWVFMLCRDNPIYEIIKNNRFNEFSELIG